MEWIAIGAVVALVWWWWRQSRERASERKVARERMRKGYVRPTVERYRHRTEEERAPALHAAEEARLDAWLSRRTGRNRSPDPKATRTIRDMPPDAPTARRATRGRGLWGGLLDRRDVLILDTETTGLGERAEVIEVAVLDTTGAVRFEALSMPVGRISAEAAAIHGLTRRRLTAEGACPWPAVHDELAPMLSGATVVLAWNAAFDRRMLNQTSARHGLGFAGIRFRDMMTEYRNLRSEARGKGRHSLSAVATREGIGRYEAHRAQGDCRAVLAVMRAVSARS